MRLIALFLTLMTAVPVVAAERTFVLSPADLARMMNEFSAAALGKSGSLGRQVGVHGNAIRFFGRICQPLTGGYAASRVRVLDGAGRAALLAGPRPNLALGSALQSMGADAWGPPATARTHQPSWVSEAAGPGTVGFAIAGFATGDPTGTLGAAAVGNAAPSFLVGVDLTPDFATKPAALVLALTTELPPSRPGRMPKRSECFLIGSAYPADVQALAELLAATTLPAATRTRLENIVEDAIVWLRKEQPQRAARAAKRFALAVASRSGSEIPGDAAEQMVMRALLVSDALGL
jgi:hypothetical protein